MSAMQQPTPNHQSETFGSGQTQFFECEALSADHPEIQARERARQERLQLSNPTEKQARPAFGGMMRFSIAPTFDAVCLIGAEFVSGEVYHVERNFAGGANFTPIARFFAWRPVHPEGYHPYWRVDCFVRVHELSPEPKVMGKALAKALLHEDICTEPLWVSWHRSEEIGGTNFGEVFDFD